MTPPGHDDQPASSPLDAEREKLRKAGYNDTEISQILVARALGSSGPAADVSTSGQGVLSGAVSSFVAIGSYARSTVFTIRHDLATIFDAAASASARVGAAAMLVFKVAVISVLAYAGWQEWRQHIISATEIAESQARKIRAEECSARVESAAKNMRLSDLENGIYSNEELARDCDPNYAHRKALEAACSTKLNTIIDAISTLTTDELNAKLEEHKKSCAITDADREAANAKIAVMENERKQRVAEFASQIQDEIKAKKQFEAGHYEEAYKLASDRAIATDALETKLARKPGDLTAIALAELSLYGLFARKYSQALDASERSLKLRASLSAETNHAHALMMLGRKDEAKAIYLARTGETVDNKKWEQVISEDFAKLRQAGITHPMMAEIETAFNPGPVELSPPPALAAATKAEDHAAAFKKAQEEEKTATYMEPAFSGRPGAVTAGAAREVAWQGLFVREFAKALEASDRAIAITPDDLLPVTDRAHALMFLGRTAEAKTIYLAHRGETLLGKKWEQVISEDFAKLRQAGITHPMMAEVEKELITPSHGVASMLRQLPPPISTLPPLKRKEK